MHNELMMVFAGIVAGLMWAIADASWFIANDVLSEPVSFPIVTTVNKQTNKQVVNEFARKVESSSWNVCNVTMFQGPGMVAAIWGIFYGEIRVIAIFEILRVDLRKFFLMNERFILLGKAELRHLSCRFCRHHYRGCTHGQIKDVTLMARIFE